MSFARSLLLLLSLALAWVAVYLLDQLSLAGLYPEWLLARVPRLAWSLRWLPGDVRTLGIWLALLASLLFGLAIPTWIGISSRRLELHPQALHRGRGNALYLGLIAAMLLIALLLAATTPAMGAEQRGWLRTALWLAALALAPIAARVAQRGRTRRVAGDDGGAPERGWPWLLVILAAAAFLFSWQNSRLPGTLPVGSTLAGLQSLNPDFLRDGPLAVGSAGLPHFAMLLTAVTTRLAPTPLEGLAWSGLAGGLALLIAIWLAACELFRRTRLHDGDGEIIDDDGRAPALWAAMAATAALPVIHFARLPLFLEPIVWGTLGIWALLRGLRRGRHGWLVASGAFLGLAILTQGAGLIFVAVGLLAWVGVALLRGSWLRSELGGVGRKGLLLWAATLAVAAAPAFCLWACGPQSPAAGWLTRLESWNAVALGLRSAVEALGISLDLQPRQSALLAAWALTLTPLLLLGFTGLLFQVDHVVGWLGAGWLLLALLAAAPTDEPTARWALLLAGLPAAAMAIAFALDRVRATLTRAAGGWLNSAMVLLASGLLVVGGLAAWRAYPAVAGAASDDTSALARAVAPAVAANADRPLAILTGDDTLVWETPALRLAAVDHNADAPRLTLPVHEPALWPATLPPQTRIFLPPALSGAGAQLRAHYPGGSFLVRRDLRGNPTVYIYQLP